MVNTSSMSSTTNGALYTNDTKPKKMILPYLSFIIEIIYKEVRYHTHNLIVLLQLFYLFIYFTM